MPEYVKNFKGNEHLIDELLKKDFQSLVDVDNLFLTHYTTSKIHEGIKRGDLLQGTFRASSDNFLEGSVNVETYTQLVFV